MLNPFTCCQHDGQMVISNEPSIQESYAHLVSQTTANAPLLSSAPYSPYADAFSDIQLTIFCTTKCMCIQNGSLYHADCVVRIGMTAKAWQRVKEDTAWTWPLIKFLLGSASFMVWWAAFRHWLPHMCSSRKQFWRTLRSVCIHAQNSSYAMKCHTMFTAMHCKSWYLALY